MVEERQVAVHRYVTPDRGFPGCPADTISILLQQSAKLPRSTQLALQVGFGSIYRSFPGMLVCELASPGLAAHGNNAASPTGELGSTFGVECSPACRCSMLSSPLFLVRNHCDLPSHPRRPASSKHPWCTPHILMHMPSSPSQPWQSQPRRPCPAASRLITPMDR